MSTETLRPFARQAIRRLAYWTVALAALLWRRQRDDEPGSPVESILVIRLDLLGDVLFSRQATQGFRAAYPQARIVMLTLPYTAPLAQSFPEVDEVIAVDTNRIRRPAGLLSPATWRNYYSAFARLRHYRFDIAVGLSGPMASLWAALSGARETVGFETEAYPRILTRSVSGGRYLERKHEVEYVRSLAAAVGAEIFPEHLSAPVHRGAEERVEALLERFDLTGPGSLVLIHAGATNGAAKRWPPRHWARFADELRSRTACRVALIGAAGDRPIADLVLESAASPIVSLVGATLIDELVALIARADLVATGDSGPLHLAVALGRPLVSIYGPTDPQIHGPFHPTAPVAIHRRDLPCSPCYTMAATADCPLGDPICMRLVSVAEVVESALTLLASGAPRSAAGAEDELLVAQKDALQDAERRQRRDQ